MKILKLVSVAALAVTFGSAANASTCIGNCGTAAPNGDVTAPPSGGPNYGYVSTSGGVNGAGQIASVGGTNGSELTTDAFSASAGDPLNFFFNYITSDGTGSFPDYGFAELLTGAGASVGFLFTARTVVNPGNTSPGFGLPVNISTLTPLTSPIIGGATNWAQLGANSGACFGGVGNGCGSTGWIQSQYTIGTGGQYKIRFGASNFGDTLLNSGLAFAGITVAGEPVDPGAVPEPATWAMLILGFGAVGAAMRRRRHTARVSFA